MCMYVPGYAQACLCVLWGQSSSLALSVLFRRPPLYQGPHFCALPTQAQSKPSAWAGRHSTWLLEPSAGEGTWIPGQILFPPSFPGGPGPGCFHSPPAVGVDRLGVEAPRRCPSPPFPASFPRDPGCDVCVCVGGRFQIFLPVREVTCQRNLPLHFLAIFLFLSNGAQGSRGETGFSRFLSIFCRNAVTALQGLCECRMLGKFLSHLPSILSAAKICGPLRGSPGVNPLPDL